MLAPLLTLSCAPVGAWFNSAPTTRLRTGQRVSLHGSGPPVLFSSGLNGLLSRRVYSDLFRNLETNVTLVVLDDAAPVTAAVATDAADALGVDKLGFLAHFSVDASILDSERIGAAVLCDPVSMPTFGLNGLTQPSRQTRFPVLVWQTELAADADARLPPFLAPNIDREALTVRTFDGVGVADLLDDAAADISKRALPWMRGAAAPVARFADWQFDRDRARGVDALRGAYRAAVARSAAECFLLPEWEWYGRAADEEADSPDAPPARSASAFLPKNFK